MFGLNMQGYKMQASALLPLQLQFTKLYKTRLHLGVQTGWYILMKISRKLINLGLLSPNKNIHPI